MSSSVPDSSDSRLSTVPTEQGDRLDQSPSHFSKETTELERTPSRTAQLSTTLSRLSHSNKTQEADQNSQVPPQLWRECVMVFTIVMGQIMSLAPLGTVLAPLQIIQTSFNSDAGGAVWYLAAFALTTGTFILIMGQLGEIYGHRRLFVIGWASLAVWSFIAAFTVYSRSSVFFDICRGFQGVAAAALGPNALALLGILYPPGPRKAVVFCFFAAGSPTGFFMGALFSSMLAQFAWWPWAFWLTSIVCTLMVPATLYFVPKPYIEDANLPASQGWIRHFLEKFDYLGAITGVTGLMLFNIAWNQGPAAGWNSPYIITFCVVGVVLLAVFLFIEGKVAHPLVPVNELSPSVALVLTCVALGWAGFGVWIYYWWEFVEVIQGASPLSGCAQILPAIITAYISAIIVAFIVMKIRPCWIMLMAAIGFFGGSLITVLTQPSTLYWKQLFWAVLIIPFGMDMSFPASTLLLSDMMSSEHQGIAASLVVTVVNYSIALGLGVAGTVQNHYNRFGLLNGYRGGQWTGVGLTGIMILCTLYFCASDTWEQRRLKKTGAKEERNHVNSTV